MSDKPMLDTNADTEKELFTNAMRGEMADEAPAPEPEVKEEPKPEPKSAKPVAKEAPEPEDEGEDDGEAEGGEPDKTEEKPKGRVPAWRLAEEAERKREEKERADRAEREVQELRKQFEEMRLQMMKPQQPQQPEQAPQIPDPIMDPEGYYNFTVNQNKRELATIRLETNLQLAAMKHGDTFDRAYQAFVNEAQRNEAWGRAIVNSPNPGEAMVQWHRGQEVLAKVGNDPAAYEAKLREDALANALNDPAFIAKAIEKAKAQAGAGGNVVTALPPSIAKASASGRTPDNEPDIASMSEQDLLRDALRR